MHRSRQFQKESSFFRGCGIKICIPWNSNSDVTSLAIRWSLAIMILLIQVSLFQLVVNWPVYRFVKIDTLYVALPQTYTLQ